MDNQDESDAMTNTLLTPEEQSITLELATMMGGAASSVLSMLIDQPAELGQPEISIFNNIGELVNQGIPVPSVIAVLRFQGRVTLPVAYMLDLPSAVRMANLMIGNAAEETTEEISDIQLGAISEAISQMMAAAANNLAQSLSQPVEITNPQVQVFSPNQFIELMPESTQDAMVLVQYQLTAGDVIPGCGFLQITPLQPLHQLIQAVQTAASPEALEAMMEEGDSTPQGLAQPGRADTQMAGVAVGGAMQEQTGMGMASGSSMASGGLGGSATGEYYAAGSQSEVRQMSETPVTVRPVEFPSFDEHAPAYGALNKNLDLVMDVSLNLTVELGRTELPIKEVLELTRGSVIELNRVAGETVDLYANGKMIAKGEVVVIEDNFGLRITSIVSPADRLRGL